MAMIRRAGVLGFGLILAAAVAAREAEGPAETPRFRHASLAAYPQAVISLKHPRTGMMFYVESDGRRLVAIDSEGRLTWGLDVQEEAGITPAIGQQAIRHLRLAGDVLWATCDKHDQVRIDVATGRTRPGGAD